ncbi:MAG: ParB/RepB/Spo0J family partition protein [Desulfovibrio sp.]|jgi:ParB family chromosome partitioning protein|nr:ParB/RepB/Spo0J family partition protein [Desulfovibrio sp.]
MPNKQLGRGLEALFKSKGDYFGGKQDGDVRMVSVASLKVNPHQPRQTFDESSLQELADSIRNQGVLQPLLVRPDPAGGLQIVAGERRWRAAKMAGVAEVPVLVKKLDDADLRVVALIENLQREDLDPMEQAMAMDDLRRTLDMTQDEVARRLGKNRSTVANTLRLLALPDKAKTALRDGSISPGHARCLLAVEDEGARQEMLDAIVARTLSVRQTEQALDHWRRHRTLPWGKEEEAAPARSGGARRTRSRKKPPALTKLQRDLGVHFGCKALVSGTEEAGKITLPYATKEELQGLLHRMGVNA